MDYDKKLGLPDIFTTRESYRLDLRWDDVLYERDGECRLLGARFSGPVLSKAARINPNDHMILDFYKQYYVFAKNVYLAKLSWSIPVYNDDGTICLNDAMLSHDTELNRVPKLNGTDYILIDTIGHEDHDHQFNLTYTTYVMNVDDKLYNFWEFHTYRQV